MAVLRWPCLRRLHLWWSSLPGLEHSISLWPRGDPLEDPKCHHHLDWGLVAMVVPWDMLPPLWKRNFNFLKDVGDLEDKLFNFLGLGEIYDWFDDLEDRHPEIPRVLARTTRLMGFGGIIVVFGVLCVIKCVLDLAVALFIVLYVLARVYLVVECFINLAHLPESAYELPKWSQYVPHIG